MADSECWDTVDHCDAEDSIRLLDDCRPPNCSFAARAGVVGPSEAAQAIEAFFVSHGLARHAQQLSEAIDADSIDDLGLLDEMVVESLISSLGLKIASAQKLRLAFRSVSLATTSNDQLLESQAVASSPMPPPLPAPAPTVILEECIVVCIDRSSSMGSPFNELTINVACGAARQSVAQRTRMEAVKAMFYAFRDRLESVQQTGSHRLGLLQYDHEVEVLLGLTESLDQFERAVDDMQKRGSTAIYSAICEAVQMLQPYHEKSTSTDLRVVVLTDGQNNTGVGAQAAFDAANSIGAVVDAIIVGDKPDPNLRRIVTGTGGQCFMIQDLGQGFELLEAETVVTLRARRGGADKPNLERRGHVTLDSFHQGEIMSRAEVMHAPPAALAPVTTVESAVSRVSSTGAGPVVRRALVELKSLANSSDRHDGVQVFPCESDITFWRALIDGPRGSPFEGGVFALHVRLPPDYPFRPPSIRFETPIYHCNVNDAGSICLDILKEHWSPALSVVKALASVRSLMADPNPNDALRQWIAELTQAHLTNGAADTRYVDEARARTARDASRSVEDWKSEWARVA